MCPSLPPPPSLSPSHLYVGRLSSDLTSISMILDPDTELPIRVVIQAAQSLDQVCCACVCGGGRRTGGRAGRGGLYTVQVARLRQHMRSGEQVRAGEQMTARGQMRAEGEQRIAGEPEARQGMHGEGGHSAVG